MRSGGHPDALVGLRDPFPHLAVVGRERLERPGVVLVATTRKNGTPRASPVEPFFSEGELWLSMMWRSAKARPPARGRDERRDPEEQPELRGLESGAPTDGTEPSRTAPAWRTRAPLPRCGRFRIWIASPSSTSSRRRASTSHPAK